MSLRKAARRAIRAVVWRFPIRVPGRLVRSLDRLLRPADREVADVFGVPFPFDFTLDRYVANMYHRNYEEAEVRCVRREVRPGGTVLDVGANIGYLAAVAASAAGPGGRVLAVEPVPALVSGLVAFARLAAGAGYRVETHALALADRDGTVEVRTSTRPNIGWATAVPGMMPADQVRETHTVPALRGDALLAREGVSRLDFVKIDVEGAERWVLDGLAETLRRDQPTVLCEVCSSAQPLVGGTVAELFDRMAALGYVAWRPGRWRDRRLDASAVTGTTNVLWRRA